jgi:hypothetical protein
MDTNVKFPLTCCEGLALVIINLYTRANKAAIFAPLPIYSWRKTPPLCPSIRGQIINLQDISQKTLIENTTCNT